MYTELHIAWQVIFLIWSSKRPQYLQVQKVIGHFGDFGFGVISDIFEDLGSEKQP